MKNEARMNECFVTGIVYKKDQLVEFDGIPPVSMANPEVSGQIRNKIDIRSNMHRCKMKNDNELDT